MNHVLTLLVSALIALVGCTHQPEKSINEQNTRIKLNRIDSIYSSQGVDFDSACGYLPYHKISNLHIRYYIECYSYKGSFTTYDYGRYPIEAAAEISFYNDSLLYEDIVYSIDEFTAAMPQEINRLHLVPSKEWTKEEISNCELLLNAINKLDREFYCCIEIYNQRYYEDMQRSIDELPVGD